MRLTAVSYLNTKPFIYGIYKGDFAGQVDLSLDIPADCAKKLLSGEADLALTPVAIIPHLKEAWLVSDYCIGSTEDVKTVCLFSEQPLESVKRIYLDFHSRTSVELTRLLCANYFNVSPEFLPASEGFEAEIKGDTAGLVIGDRTIGLHRKYPFIYDLGKAWKDWTGLPFVYAAWVSTRPLDAGFIQAFNHALQLGLDHLPELIKILPAMPGLDLDEYYRRHISYDLDDAKWQGLNRFLSAIAGPDGYKLHRNVPVATI